MMTIWILIAHFHGPERPGYLVEGFTTVDLCIEARKKMDEDFREDHTTFTCKSVMVSK